MSPEGRDTLAVLVRALRDPHALSTGAFDPGAASMVRGWRVARDRSSWYASSPSQPRDPSVPWAVPPSEDVFPLADRAAVGRWLLQRGFLADADATIAAHDEAGRPPPRRWKTDSARVWHVVDRGTVSECGAHAALTGESREAPPVGEHVCPDCLFAEGGSL